MVEQLVGDQAVEADVGVVGKHPQEFALQGKIFVDLKQGSLKMDFLNRRLPFGLV